MGYLFTLATAMGLWADLLPLISPESLIWWLATFLSESERRVAPTA